MAKSEFVCECGRLRPPNETCAGCGRRVPETISEKDWRNLLQRAALANLRAATPGTPEYDREVKLSTTLRRNAHRN